MSNRRIISTEKTILDKGDNDPHPASSSSKSNITPAVPAGVIIKLLGFTAAMIVAPISIYFLSLNTVYRGNSTWAGATAAVTANIVLIGYIIVAFKDDETERLQAEEQAKKSQ